MRALLLLLFLPSAALALPDPAPSCKPNADCMVRSVQLAPAPTASLGTCSTAAKGRIRYDLTALALKICNGTSWSVVGPAGTVTSVTGTSPIVSSGGATPAISCTNATTSTAGCVSASAQSFSGAKTFLDVGAFSAGLRVAQSQDICLDGATCTNKLNFDGVNLTVVPQTNFSASVSATGSLTATVALISTRASGNAALRINSGAFFNLDGTSATKSLRYDGTDFAFTGAGVSSDAASGAIAFRAAQGARYVTNGATATRYISDDGTNITGTGPVLLSGQLRSTAGPIQADSNYVAGPYFRSSGVLFADVRGFHPDNVSAFGVKLNAATALTDVTAHIVSIQNGSTEKAFFGPDGALRVNSANTAQPTCDSTRRGRMWFFEGASTVKDRWEICAKDAADVYAWRAAY